MALKLSKIVEEISKCMEDFSEKQTHLIREALDLLKSGNVNQCNKQGQTALHLIARTHENLITNSGGLTSGFLNILTEYLVENIVDINKEDQMGNTPLHYAFHHTEPQVCVVGCILKGKPGFYIQNIYGMSPLDYLLQPPSAKIYHLEELLPHIQKAGLPLDSSIYGTPLIFIVMCRLQAGFLSLLDKYEDAFLSARDSEGRSCFRFALEKNLGGPEELINILSLSDLSDHLTTESNIHGVSNLHALMIAVCNFALYAETEEEVKEKVKQFENLAKVMIEKGADMSATDVNGMTPLHTIWHYASLHYLPYQTIKPFSDFLESKSSLHSLQTKDKFGFTFQEYRQMCKETYDKIPALLHKVGKNVNPTKNNPFKYILLEEYGNRKKIQTIVNGILEDRVLGPLFVEQKEENEAIRKTVNDFVNRLCGKIGALNPGFTCTPRLAGSSGAGTKTSRLDEFDYQLNLTKLENVPVKHIDSSGCNILLPEKVDVSLQPFRHSDGYALTREMAVSFRTTTLRALADKALWDELPLQYNNAKIVLKSGIVNISMTWMGGPSSYMEIDVDLVPLISMSMKHSPVPLDIVSNRNPNIVEAFQKIGYAIQLTGEYHAQITFSRLESNIMSNLEKECKVAYGIAKLICGGTYLPHQCRGGEMFPLRRQVDSYSLKMSIFNKLDPNYKYPLSLLCPDREQVASPGGEETNLDMDEVMEILEHMMVFHEEQFPLNNVRSKMPVYLDPNNQHLLQKVVLYSNPDLVLH